MKDAYYFTHDSNAKDDPKCVLLIDQLGLEGYGIYWVLVETLREQPGYRYPLKLVPALAKRFSTTAEKMNTVIKGYGLFSVENEDFFFSQSLRKRMIRWDDKRLKYSENGKKSGEARRSKSIANEPLLNNCSAIVKQLPELIDKNRIDKNKKESKKKSASLLSLPDRQKEFQEELQGYAEAYPERYSPEMLKAFYTYWSEPTKDEKKMRRELEKTWSTKGRLTTWKRYEEERRARK